MTYILLVLHIILSIMYGWLTYTNSSWLYGICAPAGFRKDHLHHVHPGRRCGGEHHFGSSVYFWLCALGHPRNGRCRRGGCHGRRPVGGRCDVSDFQSDKEYRCAVQGEVSAAG